MTSAHHAILKLLSETEPMSVDQIARPFFGKPCANRRQVKGALAGLLLAELVRIHGWPEADGSTTNNWVRTPAGTAALAGERVAA